MAFGRKPSNIFFAVTGRGEFPLNMLHRDEAEFLSDKDKVVADTFQITAGESERVVNLVMRGRDQFNSPTIKRWESFGWKVGSIFVIDAGLPEAEALLEIQWTRIARAKMELPAGWGLKTTGNLDGLERLTAVAANLEEIAINVREVYETLRRIDVERMQLLTQRDAVREFFNGKE